MRRCPESFSGQWFRKKMSSISLHPLSVVSSFTMAFFGQLSLARVRPNELTTPWVASCWSKLISACVIKAQQAVLLGTLCSPVYLTARMVESEVTEEVLLLADFWDRFCSLVKIQADEEAVTSDLKAHKLAIFFKHNYIFRYSSFSHTMWYSSIIFLHVTIIKYINYGHKNDKVSTDVLFLLFQKCNCLKITMNYVNFQLL